MFSYNLIKIHLLKKNHVKETLKYYFFSCLFENR